jgi:DNA polymerase-3 subunit delta
MKLEPRRIEAFLKDPGTVRVVLLYGDDAGLIADRTARLVRHIAGAVADPFRTVELTRERWAQIADEFASLPLSGGRRVVRVRDASDACVAEVEAALAGNGTGLLILEAPGLPARSRLRAAIERAADAVAIGCYAAEGANLGREIRERLQERGVAVETAALAWLEARLGGDLTATRAEIEKLALFVGPGNTADLAAVQACVGDLAAVSVEDALFAATAGNIPGVDRALGVALAEGAAPVGVLRAALGHVQRLHRARIAFDAGATAEEAVKGLRPPLFFRREPDFLKALRIWPESRLAAAAAALWRDESACKRTGAPADAICRSAVLALALRAASLRGGQG